MTFKQHISVDLVEAINVVLTHTSTYRCLHTPAPRCHGSWIFLLFHHAILSAAVAHSGVRAYRSPMQQMHFCSTSFCIVVTFSIIIHFLHSYCTFYESVLEETVLFTAKLKYDWITSARRLFFILLVALHTSNLTSAKNQTLGFTLHRQVRLA